MNKYFIIFTAFIALIMSLFFTTVDAYASSENLGVVNKYIQYGIPSSIQVAVPSDKYVFLLYYISGDYETVRVVYADSPFELIDYLKPTGLTVCYTPTGLNKQYRVIGYTRDMVTNTSWKKEYDLSGETVPSGVSYLDNKMIYLVYTNHDIKYKGEIVEPNQDIVNSGVDIGFDNWTNTVTSSTGIYDSSVPVIGTFKVQYQGVGALASHLLSWATSNVNNDYHVELKAYYEFQSTKSWALKKDYNKSTFTFIDYADNYKSSKGALSFALSSANSDNSIIAKALQDVSEKFGQAEGMSGLTANDSSNSIKAYYIRNVYKASDGKYHYGRWVRCKVGDMYQASTVTEIDENGNTDTGSIDYPIDSSGNPIYSADGGNISTGNSFFDTIISAIGGIGTFFATLGTMVTSLVSGIGQVPQVLSALLSGFPPVIWSMVALGFLGVIIMRFVGR